MTFPIDLYYYSTTTPSGLAIPDWNGQTGAPVSEITRTDTTNVWMITYQIQELSYYVLNTLLQMYVKNTSQIQQLIAATSNATSYTISYRDRNMDTLNSLRYKFCFTPEPIAKQYCPDIPNYNSTSENVKCSRIISFNPQYNDGTNSNNNVQCSSLMTSLSDPQNANYDNMSALFRSYCNTNPDSYDCQCFVRSRNELYQQTKDALGGGAVNDVCWYKPCSYQTNIFVPPELLNAPASCPSVCANVIIASNVAGNLNLNNVAMNNNCFKAAQIETVATSAPSNPATAAATTMKSLKINNNTFLPATSLSPSPTDPSIQKNINIIIIFIVIGVLVFFGLVGYLWQKRSIAPNPSKSI